MPDFSRRDFLQLTGAGLAGGAFAGGFSTGLLANAETTAPRKKLAVITTEWRYRSHAWHMAERFLAGYPRQGEWHRPPFQVVSAYVDQFPENDLSRGRAKEFGFTIYPSVAEALRCGSEKLAVDAVLIIGEHGKYPLSTIGQTKYPRYEFFQQAVEVYAEDGRSAPIFNDKHLSWNWDWAVEMVQWSETYKFGFCAGSSLPVTWRMPAVDLPYGAEVEELMCLSPGSVDSYDFHNLEVIQCMAERRKGGETGVKWIQALRGPAVWQAADKKSWTDGGWDPQLFEACIARSHNLAQADTNSHRKPSTAQIREWVKEPILYRFEYVDGTRATMLMLNGLVSDFTFAARLKGETKLLSTQFHLPPAPNIGYSAALMAQAEETFITNKSPTPIRRTLLTTGLVEAGVRSLAQGEKLILTPHLEKVNYTAPEKSTFWHE